MMVPSTFFKRTSVVAIVTAVIAIPLASHAGEATTSESTLMRDASPASAPACRPADKCCRVCSAGKACGNSCIQASKVCHKGRGCACNDAEICSGS